MNIKYSKTHEWAAQAGDLYICGLSDYAQEKIGDVVFVELPEVGKNVNQGEPFGVIESVKSANDLYSPVTGEVVEVNEELEDQPELVNSSPLGEGWICKIKVSDCSFDNLLSEEDYQAFLEEEEED